MEAWRATLTLTCSLRDALGGDDGSKLMIFVLYGPELLLRPHTLACVTELQSDYWHFPVVHS